MDRARLDDAQQAPALIARVLDAALRQSRPVYLEIPGDMPQQACDDVPVTTEPAVDPQALDACAGELLQRLHSALRPILMVGVEVRRYGLEAKVAELARRLQIPVVTTFMGRGLLTGCDISLRGTYLGLAGCPELSAQVENSDALLLLGAIVSDTNFAVSGQRIDLRFAIQALGATVTMGHHVYPDVPLARLVDALLERVSPSGAQRTPQPSSPNIDDMPAGGDTAVAPADIARAVNRLLRRQGTMALACDVGDCLFTAMEIDPTDLIAPGYYATMGYGVPAGLGLQAATGQRPLILVGDGAFQMTGWELGNARRYGWDPIVLVFNNAGWEMLRAFEPQARFNDLGSWDFASMAAGMGGDGHVARTGAELERILAQAHATRGRFQLIDIRLAPGARSPTLTRFVEAVRRLSAVPAAAPEAVTVRQALHN